MRHSGHEVPRNGRTMSGTMQVLRLASLALDDSTLGIKAVAANMPRNPEKQPSFPRALPGPDEYNQDKKRQPFSRGRWVL